MSMLDDLQLEQVRTEKGKHAHKRKPGSMLAICYAKGPFWVVSDAEAKERRLTPCLNCERREARLRAGDTRQAQGEKNFDAVVPMYPLSYERLAMLKEYAARRRI